MGGNHPPSVAKPPQKPDMSFDNGCWPRPLNSEIITIKSLKTGRKTMKHLKIKWTKMAFFHQKLRFFFSRMLRPNKTLALLIGFFHHCIIAIQLNPEYTLKGKLDVSLHLVTVTTRVIAFLGSEIPNQTFILWLASCVAIPKIIPKYYLFSKDSTPCSCPAVVDQESFFVKVL